MSGHSDEAMDRPGIGPDEVHFSKKHFSATGLARRIRDAVSMVAFDRPGRGSDNEFKHMPVTFTWALAAGIAWSW